MATILVHGGTQTAELIIGQLKHTSQTTKLAAILGWKFYRTLITDIVLDSRPHMLQRGAHLYLKRDIRKFALTHITNIMQRIVTKTC